MATMTLDNFVALVRKSTLLDAGQLKDVGDLQKRFPEPKALAKEMIRRGWVTAYQINQLSQGHGQDLVLGQYVILERLGEGGMGQVFKARHRSMGRVVALKVIRKERLAGTDAVRRFQREIEAAGKLSHRNIVMAYDAADIGGTYFFAMEFVEGVDLSQLIKKSGPLPISKACDFMHQAALGLEHAHECGMVHRDIKPANLLLTKKGNVVKILDMGLARLGETDRNPNLTALTQDGRIMGTPDYIAPEQARNSHTADIRADLYSLGCTFYFLLTGRVPFPGAESVMEKLLKHQMEEPVPIETIRPEVPPEIRHILGRLLAKRPEDRYQTPAELATALAPFIHGDSLAAISLSESSARTMVPGTGSAGSSSVTAAAAGAGEMPSARPGLASHLLGAALGLLVLASKGLLWLGLLLARPGPERSRRVMRGVLAGTLAAGVLLAAILFATRSGTGPADDGKSPSNPLVEKFFPNQPKELAAVLGDFRGRNWGTVRILAFSPDGTIMATGDETCAIRLWDMDTMHEHGCLRGHSGLLLAMNFSPDGRTLASLSSDRNQRDEMLKLWNVDTAKEQASYQGFAGNNTLHPSTVALAPGGNAVAWMSWGREATALKLWETATRKERTICSFPPGGGTMIQSLIFSPNGKSLAAQGRRTDGMSTNAVVKVWNVASGNETYQKAIPGGSNVHNVQGFFQEGKNLAFSLDGNTLAVGDVSGNVLLWEATSGKEEKTLKGFPGAVNTVSLSPDGRTAAAIGWIKEGQTQFSAMKVWDVDKESEKFLLRSFPGNVSQVAFVPPDGKTIATTSGEQVVRFWDAASGKERGPVQETSFPLKFAVLSPDNNILAAGGFENKVRLWDRSTKKELRTLQGHSSNVSCAAFSHDGKTLATGSYDSSARLWDVDTGKSKVLVQGNSSPILSLAFAPDGKTLALGRQESNVRLYDVASGQERAVAAGNTMGVHFLAYSADGQTLMTGGFDGSAKIWDLAQQKERTAKGRETFGFGYSGSGYVLAFSPDARSLAIGSQDGAIRIWDAATGKLKLPPQEPKGKILALAFSPDGQLLASSGQDGRVLLWKAASAEKLIEWEMPGPINGLAFTSDRAYLVTANANGTMFVLRVPSVAETARR